MAQNGGGLRLAATLALAAALAACTVQNASAPPHSPTSQAQSQAADLRTHLDLLLSEQVIIIAKETAAAVNHSGEYSAYTALLATNSADLTTLMARAFGNTAASQFAQAWNTQNGLLVDYGIAIVTHNDDKAKNAIASLTASQFAIVIADSSRLPVELVTQLLRQQVLADKTFIDDVSAGNFKAYYPDLHSAYGQSSLLGDSFAKQIALTFPDKYPGDPSALAVDVRVRFNEALQEHSYLATMATDATVNGRDAEKAQAFSSLAKNNEEMRGLFADQRAAQAWSQESASLEAYAATHDATSRKALAKVFVGVLATFSRAPAAVIATHENATITVIDDQRAKSNSVADDDRAAATSMQPIADSFA